jgi:RsiW-degrading membrane proteinase PrsW (M82 family)
MLNQQDSSLEQKVGGYVKCVHRRNRREIMAACAVIAVFALDIAYEIYRQNEDTLSIVGSGVIIFVLLLNIIIIWRKLHIPKSELSAFPPTQFPEKWKYYLTRQARMLRLSWLWYLLPLFLGLCINLLSDASSGLVIVPLLIIAAVYTGVWWLNLKAAKRIERDRNAWFGNLRTV